MEDRITDALIFAAQAHKGQKRKLENYPYILHPIHVAAVAGTILPDENLICAALLHDVIEDCNVQPEEIRKQFGDDVLNLVLSETEDKHEGQNKSDTWYLRKEESLNILKDTKDIKVKALWLSDKLANLRSFYSAFQKHGHDIWLNLNQKDPKMQKWYYYTIKDYVKELSDTQAYKEYEHICKKMFEEGENL